MGHRVDEESAWLTRGAAHRPRARGRQERRRGDAGGGGGDTLFLTKNDVKHGLITGEVLHSRKFKQQER